MELNSVEIEIHHYLGTDDVSRASVWVVSHLWFFFFSFIFPLITEIQLSYFDLIQHQIITLTECFNARCNTIRMHIFYDFSTSGWSEISYIKIT